MSNPEDAHDAALSRLTGLSPEYGDAMSDHAPMVIDALVRLGRPEAIAPYLESILPKRRHLSDEPAPLLSSFARVAGEAARDIERLGIAKAVEARLPRLAGGFAGAAFHGSIRVGHALRSLGRRDTAPRREELARALAYAELRGTPLPTPIRGGAPPRTPAAALREISPSPDAMSPRTTGLISTALEDRTATHHELAAFAGALVLPADPRAALHELFEASVDLFLRGEYLPQAAFTMLHGVTGMDAAIAIADCLDDEHARRLAQAAAHALLALRVAFVGTYPARAADPPGRSLDEGSDVAVRSLDDHAIKLAAALQAAGDTIPRERLAAALEIWTGRFA